MRLNTWDDLAKFQKASTEYFMANKGLTWKRFCDGLKDMDGVDLED